eukprot:TRINITY_DN2210_c0_g2_i2.p1 TRINITY_DN2210_c0_g2~~TRINITY_DN2210_c0_g2_i2.p1  ORF type:complete len:350 (+),score=95.53 TRINITY_DN2210_c0_g2_i2:455-1504(+)
MSLLPKTSKFYYFKTFGSDGEGLELDEQPIPKLGEKEVLVKIHYVSLNYRDLLVSNKQLPIGDFEKLIPGLDASGEVVEVGGAVKDLKVGDRVISIIAQEWLAGPIKPHHFASSLGAGVQGVFTEYRVFPDYAVVKIPSTLPYDEASTISCAGVNAFGVLFEGPTPIRADQTVLILGTGGVSIFSLQFAKAAGARVIITSSSDEKLEIARKLGANEVINYKKHPDWENKVLELTGGEGVDLVIENGGAGTIVKSVKSLRLGGTVAVIGFLDAANLDAEKTLTQNILFKAATIRGILTGSKQTTEDTVKFITLHKIKPLIDKIFPFSELKAAFKYLKDQKHVGKVVIKIH